jgi:UDP-N-acetylmuramoylalanine--D-glutamate ligase
MVGDVREMAGGVDSKTGPRVAQVIPPGKTPVHTQRLGRDANDPARRMESPHRRPTDLSGKRVTVAGLGHFGGGVAVAKWLVGQGARVLVTDKAPAEKLADALPQLAGLPIEYRLGGHDERDFTSADLVVASPAIPPSNPYLTAARAAGVPVTTEICLFARRCQAPVVGVTGTKGKSTTSAMLAAVLGRRFTTWFGGNIGKSLLPDLPNIQPDHVVVLELSSFMLHYLGEVGWSPHVAVFTLLVPDHLDWHGSFAAYADAKRNLLRFQKAGDVAVVNEEATGLDDWVRGRDGVVRYGVEGRRPFDLLVPGRHNQVNAQGAFAAAAALGVSWDDARVALAGFRGLPHRLELVHESGGVRWFNDSIATVAEASAASLAAFEPGRVIQVVGGASKGLDAEPLVRALAGRAKAVLCVGATGPMMADRLRSAGRAADVHDCGDLPTAVATAKRLAAPGDVVLLSTGFASYDQFAHFEDRGHTFARLARAT